MPAIKCPCCNNLAHPRLRKGNVEYLQCESCLTLFSEPLENSDMVGGGNEEQRNKLQNHERVARIDSFCRDVQKAEVNILDFGCGNGMLLDDLHKAGYYADGYDVYSEIYSRLPEKNKYHIVTAIEVIEHTSWPYVELDVIHRSLKTGGFVMIETSFIDIARQENIELEDFFYIEPSVGHATIFSHWGLDVLMSLRGFRPMQHLNRNVRVYQKR